MAITIESIVRDAGRSTLETAVWPYALAAAVVHWYVCQSLSSPYALDMDTVNLMYAMSHFDIGRLSPHPPGYLPYVLLLRAIQFLSGGAPLDTVLFCARFFSAATVFAIPFLVDALQPTDKSAPRFAALLAAFHPFLLFHGADGQTHSAEVFVATLLYLTLLKPDTSSIFKIALLLATGTALRPTFLLSAVGPIIWRYWRNKSGWMWIAVSGVAATLLWLLPTIYLTGGIERYILAHRAFIWGNFIQRPPSNLSVTRTIIWSLLLALPLLPSFFRARVPQRSLIYITATAALPLILFYLLAYISEPGYLQSLVPLAVAWTALLVLRRRRRRTMATLAFALQTAVLFLPEGGRIQIKTPSIQEIVNREVESEVLLEKLNAVVKPTDRVLYITDYAGSAFQRQLPLLRRGTDVLILYRFGERKAFIPAMSFSTDDQLISLPGDVVFADGSRTQLDTKTTYDAIVLSPLMSVELRDMISRNTRCAFATGRPADTPIHLTAACFPNGVFRIADFEVLFHPEGRKDQEPITE